MNLDDLKPAWQQYKLQNSLEGIDRQAVLGIIDNANEEIRMNSAMRLAANAAMFLILLICCQGG